MLRKLAGFVSVAALVLGLGVTPAHAHSSATVVQGNLNINPGLWLPPFGPDVAAVWNLISTVGVPVAVAGGGNLIGNCAHWLGVGNMNVAGDTIPTQWDVAGGTAVITGSSGSHSLRGSLQIRAVPSGSGQAPCVTEAARNFTFFGTLTVTDLARTG